MKRKKGAGSKRAAVGPLQRRVHAGRVASFARTHAADEEKGQIITVFCFVRKGSCRMIGHLPYADVLTLSLYDGRLYLRLVFFCFAAVAFGRRVVEFL